MIGVLRFNCKEFLVGGLVEWHWVEMRVQNSSSFFASSAVGLKSGDKTGSLILSVLNIVVRVQ